ncbi:hypothetical protein CKA32_006444 [Geitlerinema sp. FC II]|nr:hypothetical protein CKA32_006444 [Geitlerinema sp. FC II]
MDVGAHGVEASQISPFSTRARGSIPCEAGGLAMLSPSQGDLMLILVAFLDLVFQFIT